MKKNNYLLLLSFLFIIFLLSAGFALALEIKNYPPIPGYLTPSADCKGNDCLSIYIAYFFGALIYLAGALSLISFVIGAVGLIAAMDSAESASNAKDRMKGAVLGLILTLSSFVILRTINLNLVTPSLTPLPGVQGIYYFNGSERKPVALDVADVSQEQPVKDGFKKIIYDCVKGSESLAPNLLIWEFSGPNFSGDYSSSSGAKVAIKKCGEEEDISKWKSFKMTYETPGVYYCLNGCSGKECNGYMSPVVTNNDNSINKTFFGKMKGVRIVNSDRDGLYFGAIFHGKIDIENGGVCTYPIINDYSDPLCAPINIATAAVEVFKINKTPENSGDGVDFFSAPWGVETNKNGGIAGFFEVKKEDIRSGGFTLKTERMCFTYTNVNVPDYEKFKCKDSKCGGRTAADAKEDETEDNCSSTACESLWDCPGSLEIHGNYLVGIYSKDKSNGSDYCQTFRKDVPNLGGRQILPPGTERTDRIYIIPTQ